jgi:4-hydroxybenzoate polyprenyltransferase
LNNIGALIGASAADTETIFVIIAFLITAVAAFIVLAVTKAFSEPEPDELHKPISEKAMRYLCQRVERERSLDPNRQS